MSYRCEVCGNLAEPGPVRRWEDYREDGSLRRSLAVCNECHDDALAGCNLSVALEEYGPGTATYGRPDPPPTKHLPVPREFWASNCTR
jgi:hypothetical protein